MEDEAAVIELPPPAFEFPSTALSPYNEYEEFCKPRSPLFPPHAHSSLNPSAYSEYIHTYQHPPSPRNASGGCGCICTRSIARMMRSLFATTNHPNQPKTRPTKSSRNSRLSRKSYVEPVYPQTPKISDPTPQKTHIPITEPSEPVIQTVEIQESSRPSQSPKADKVRSTNTNAASSVSPAQTQVGPELFKYYARLFEAEDEGNNINSISGTGGIFEPGSVQMKPSEHQSAERDVPIRVYVTRMRRSGIVDEPELILAYVLVHRLVSLKKLCLTAENRDGLVLASLVLASKFLQDRPYKNTVFAQHASVSPTRLRLMELHLLGLLDGNLFITSQEYSSFLVSISLQMHEFKTNEPSCSATSHGLSYSSGETPIPSPIIFSLKPSPLLPFSPSPLPATPPRPLGDFSNSRNHERSLAVDSKSKVRLISSFPLPSSMLD